MKAQQWRFSPLILKNREWHSKRPLPSSLGLIRARDVGVAHIFGLPADRANGDYRVLAYHTITDTWAETESISLEGRPAAAFKMASFILLLALFRVDNPVTAISLAFESGKTQVFDSNLNFTTLTVWVFLLSLPGQANEEVSAQYIVQRFVSALILAALEVPSLLDYMLELLALLGGSLAGIFYLGMFTTRTGKRGVIAGFVASLGVLYFCKFHTGMSFFLFGAMGVVSCVVVGHIASFVHPAEIRDLEGLTIHTLKEAGNLADP